MIAIVTIGAVSLLAGFFFVPISTSDSAHQTDALFDISGLASGGFDGATLYYALWLVSAMAVFALFVMGISMFVDELLVRYWTGLQISGLLVLHSIFLASLSIALIGMDDRLLGEFSWAAFLVPLNPPRRARCRP